MTLRRSRAIASIRSAAGRRERTRETIIMPIDPNNPLLNDPGIDCTPIAQHLVIVPPDILRGLLPALQGFDEVCKEVVDNQTTWGDEAGITSSDFAAFEQCGEIIDKANMYLPVARMIVQKLEATRAIAEDKRQRIARAIAEGVERRAKTSTKRDALLAQYQKTRAYRSAVGIKAYKTRLRNQKLAEEQQQQQQAASQAQPTPQPEPEPLALPEARPVPPTQPEAQAKNG